MPNVNVGPSHATIGGKALTLSQPDAMIMSSIFDYVIRTKREARRSFDHVIKEVSKYPDLPEGLAKAAIEYSLKIDNETAKAEQYAEPELPKAALLEKDVCAKLLHLMAHEFHPELSYEQALELVEKEGAILTIAKIGMAFPEMDEKKFQVLLSSSPNGTDSTGQDTATNSSKPVKEKSPSES